MVSDLKLNSNNNLILKTQILQSCENLVKKNLKSKKI